MTLRGEYLFATTHFYRDDLPSRSQRGISKLAIPLHIAISGGVSGPDLFTLIVFINRNNS